MRRIRLIIICLFTISCSDQPDPHVQSEQLTEVQSQELDKIIEEINGLNDPEYISIRIKLLEKALGMVTKEAKPELWAWLNGELAAALMNTPFGVRAKNIERAITHYKMALEVYTPDAYTHSWFTTQINLGGAYIHRIYEDEAENKEQAIRHFHQILNIFDQQSFPEYWAHTHMSLGIAFNYRKRDDKDKNLEQAIDHYKSALEVYTEEAFPTQWAETHLNLGHAYWNFKRKDVAEKIEQAISHYQLALKVFKRENFSVQWAEILNHLGEAYVYRRRGVQSENLERAIICFHSALETINRQNFFQLWAEIHNNLGVTYRKRILGDPIDNKEKAIFHIQQALQVHTRRVLPQKWAESQNDLANAYASRIEGDPVENLEQAIIYHNLALEVANRNTYSELWARIQNDLGISYWNRLRGNRTANVEWAINHFLSALEIRTKQALPDLWADTQHNLAVAYLGLALIKQDDKENLEKAIALFQEILEIYTYDAFPEAWASTHLNLATAYASRISDNKTDYFKRAFEHYQLALRVYTRKSFPVQWAITQSNLGNIYKNRLHGNQTENLELAIAHYQSALEVYTPRAYAEDYRQINLNLGKTLLQARAWQQANDAYDNAIEIGEKLFSLSTGREAQAKVLSDMQEAFQGQAYCLAKLHQENAALKVLEHGKTRFLKQTLFLKSLERIQLPSEELKEFKALQNKIRIFEKQLSESGLELRSTSDSTSAQEQYRRQQKLFELNVMAHKWLFTKMSESKDGVFLLHLYISLLESIDTSVRNLETFKTPSILEKQFEKLQDELKKLEQKLKWSNNEIKSPNYPANAQKLRERQSRLDELIKNIEQQSSFNTNETLEITPLLHRLVQEKIALVVINVTQEGTILFVSLPQDSTNSMDSYLVKTLFLDNFTTDSLRYLTWGDTRIASSPPNWSMIYPRIDQDRQRWHDQQPILLHRLGAYFWPQLDSLLQSHEVQQLLIVPQQELFLFPLHATPFIPLKVPFSNEFVYPIERYTICYAPSIQIYDRLTQKRAQSPVNRNALFVENPDGDLKFALSQQEWVANKLHERGFSLTRLSNAEITRENVLVHFKRSGLIHYYGHGKYNWTFPEKSGLKMFLPYGFLHKITGNTLLLTAATIEEQASFEQTQLVVLSACETGLTDVYNTHSRDQFVGLPASFIQAGAQAVIGSLWTVPDPETSLLFSRFYHELLDDKESISPAEALRRAQLWMLKANFKEIDKAAKTHLGLKNYKNHAKKKKLKDPWSHPESWGGFYIVGDGFPKFIQ